ncbi:hypothetical protein MJM04_29990, partial [Salmonella enterica subsp. enterica serovar Cerro]|nr:hypothetical protein [Salmonella enterica subsp. enterica serovar Cerro]
NEFTHEDLANMTQIDYDREMAFVAVRRMDNAEEILGVTRAISPVFSRGNISEHTCKTCIIAPV